MSKKKGSVIDKEIENQHVSKASKKSNGKGKSSAKKADLSTPAVVEESKAAKRLNIITMVGLLVLLFYSPYFRGLYFNSEMATTFLYSGILFLIFLVQKIFNKEFKVFKSPLDVAAAALVVAYFLPMLLGQAASAQYSWDKFLRYINYFLIYLIARDLTTQFKYVTVVLNGILVSAIGVSILGIDAGAGAIITNKLNQFLSSIPLALHLQGGWANIMSFKFFGGFTEGRIYSTLQYPNVLASYLGAVFILTTGLLMTSKAVWKRFLYGAAGFVIFYTFILTVSRGMFLVLPVMMLVLFIALWKKQYIIDAVIDAGIPAVIGVGISSLFQGYINLGQYNMVWLSVLGGALLAGILVVPVQAVRSRLYNVKTGIYAGVAVALAVIAVVLVGTGLNIEKPLVIKHSAGEADSDKYVIRDISGVKPDNKYALEFNLDAQAPAAGKTAYRVTVSSINQFAETVQLADINGGADKGVKKLEFTTKPDTEYVRLSMSNFSAGTSAAYSNFNLKDISTGADRRIIAEYKYLPTDAVYKIKDINLKTHNAWERLIFVKDAFKIIANYPLGAGGGGWKALYQGYQSYEYASNEVHDHPIQLWVETGIIGFAILLSIGILIIHHFYRTRKELQEEGQDNVKKIVLVSAVFAAIVSLYAHSAIDFDLSLSAMSLLVWALMGILSAFYIQRERHALEVGTGWNYTAAIVTVVMAVMLTVAGFNSVYGRIVLGGKSMFGNQVTQDQFATAVSKLTSIYEGYLSLQPYDEQTRLEYVRFCNDVAGNVPKEQTGDYFKKIQENIDICVQNEPHSANSLIQAGSFYASAGNYAKAEEYANRVAETANRAPQAYRYKAEINLIAGKYAMSNGQPELGKSFLEKAKNVRAEIAEAGKTSLKPMEIKDDLKPELDRIEKDAADAMNATPAAQAQ